MSAKRYFLDTNLFVYVFDEHAPLKAKMASTIVRRAVETGEGMISFQVVQEFFNVALRRFQQPFTVPEAEQYFLTVLKPLLAVHSSPSLYLEALRLAGRYQLAWYDALILAAALAGGCSVLYSEDLQDGLKVEGLRVENPFVR